MCITRCIAHAALICITAFLPAAWLHTPAAAQECELKVRPIDGRLGYRPRANARCEGMYVELQSAPVALRVISLMRGTVDSAALDSARSLELHIALHTLNLDPVVTILAQPTVAGVNWALDVRDTAVAGPDRKQRLAYRWNKFEAFDGTGIALDSIGFVARTRLMRGMQDPVYVPVAVTRSNDKVTADSSIHVIFHLPGASVARLCVVRYECVSGDLQPMRSGGYYDGFFQAEIPLTGTTPGELLQIVVQWRESGNASEVQRDRFDLFRW
jgi:hypothetical protein